MNENNLKSPARPLRMSNYFLFTKYLLTLVSVSSNNLRVCFIIIIQYVY